MATYTAAYTDIRINDDSRFRTQMEFISDSLETAGWTKTADTGQIDFTSVLAPTGADESKGYEVRVSTAGLYMKIEYGSGYAAYSKALWLTFGGGSNGSGTLTEVKSARHQLRTATGYSGGSVRAGDDYISATADRLTLAITDDTNATYGGAAVLQKRTNDSFVEDSYGWVLAFAQYNLSGGVQVIDLLDSSGAGVQNLGLVRFPRSVGDASNVPTTPVYVSHPYHGYVALRDALIVPTSLLAHQATATVNGRTYLSAFGNTTNAGVWGVTTAFNSSFLVRYD